jgi:type IX secretion system PorP/SprF family membrane protein
MPKLLLFIFLLIIASNAIAQQDQVYSQYMYNNMIINPGYAGSEDAISAALLHREQMVGMPGKPSTSVFHVNSPFKLFNANHGLGVSINNDNFGFNKDIGGSFSYAFRLPVKNIGKLGIGVSMGFQNKALDATWDTGEGTGAALDPAIPQPKESGLTYDLAFGLFYKTENLYLGVSSTHLTEPKVKYQTSSLTLKRHYYLSAGYNIVLTNPAFELQPTVLIASDAVTTSLDLSSSIVYNKKFWGGVSYRLGVAIVGMAGIQLFNGIRIGYSYDFATTALNKNSSGSHELMVSYSFTLSRERIPHKYKSVRFL